jgi:hypothetical protein
LSKKISASWARRVDLSREFLATSCFSDGVHAVQLGDLLADEGQLGLDLAEVLASIAMAAGITRVEGGFHENKFSTSPIH